MLKRVIKGLIVGTACLLSVNSASAQAFDPQDPYRRVFLDMMLTLASSAEIAPDWTEDWDSIRASRDVQEEIRLCGTWYRRDLLNHLLQIMEENKTDPDAMSAIADVVRAGVAFANLNEEVGKLSLDAIPDELLRREDIQLLIGYLSQYMGIEDQYYANLWFGQALIPRNAAPLEVSQTRYPSALFLVGDLNQYIALVEDGYQANIEDWPITAAMRSGRDDLARRLQADYDRTEPSNITSLLFLESETAQVAHCQGLLQGVADRMAEREELTLPAEAASTGVRFASWTLLLCGEFADARRSARKQGWFRQAQRCGEHRESSNVTDFYNGILAGSYLATEQRRNGEALRAAFTLEEIVAEVRQVLYLDSFTGLGHINIVVDEDIDLYMTHLHGMTPELRVVEGLLEEARGNTSEAVAAWRDALDSEQLHERWVITLQAWVSGQSSKVSIIDAEAES